MKAHKLDWNLILHFDPEEFDDPDEPGSWKHMDAKTVILLDWLRKNTGWPIITHNKFGIRGCVCVKPEGHSTYSRHYITHPSGCSAVDWHFETDVDKKEQIYTVMHSGFKGIGIYYGWKWGGETLSVGFHTDRRKRFTVWKREKGKYIYLC